MSIADPMDTIEVAVEQQIAGIMSATNFLEEKRRDNFARQSIIENVAYLKAVRDHLSLIIDDVGGKS